MQSAPHVMPAGADVTMPEPAPALTTVSTTWFRPNVAVTATAAVSVTTQVPVPEQPPPDQPMNVEPAPGAAVSVTTVPDA
ncbi:MAG: hypothetical protein IPL61_26040 [Myxococcales bacterium]|nr:hypothetical protein [Myxococcales bacterium]